MAEQDCRVGVVNNLALSASVLTATTKKGIINFLREKSAPPEKILATPMPRFRNFMVALLGV